ncbi:type IV pilin protein [Fibrobacterota bacterium]
MKKNKKSRGFTLVELMVVLVIIGILATLAIPKFLGATAKSKIAECKPILKEIYTLQEAFKLENSAYTDNETALGFADPGGKHFTFAAQTGGTDNITGSANLTNAIGDAAANEDVCINTSANLLAVDDVLAGYANATTNANCAF